MVRALSWLVSLAVGMPLMLGACSAELGGGKVEVEPAPVRVTIGGGGSGFCPPGQAKKGRC